MVHSLFVIGLGHASIAPVPARALARHQAPAARRHLAGAARARRAPARGPTPAAPTTRAADHDHGRAQGIFSGCVFLFSIPF